PVSIALLRPRASIIAIYYHFILVLVGFRSISVLAALSAAALAQPAPPYGAADTRKVLLVFGDSISAGYGLPPGQSFPDRFQKRLDAQGYAWRVVNQGISGDTTSGGVARLKAGTRVNPALVVLELGGNDGLRGLPLAITR